MGLFSSAKNDSAAAPSKVAAPSEVAGSSEVGTFHSVHPIDTVMDVVRQGLRSQVSSGEMVLGGPGVLASIYMSELTESRLVVTAGNVLDTYFSFGVELTSDDDGTHGRAYYDRPLAQIERWSHNAMDQASAVQSILIDASATIDGWELMGSSRVHLERDWSSPMATSTSSEGNVNPSTSSDGAQPDETPTMPSPDDQLFVSQEDWWNNACLNWCHDGWTLYATGYREAADLLVRHIEERGVDQDMLVYPILFLYRQYLELEIKDLIRQGRRLQDVPGDFPQHHDSAGLWRICHQLLAEIAPNDAVEELREIDRLIGEFSAVDPSSMAFRYPEDKNGNASLPGITHINLRNVREVMSGIGNMLTGASCLVEEHLSIKGEMKAEYRSYEADPGEDWRGEW